MPASPTGPVTPGPPGLATRARRLWATHSEVVFPGSDTAVAVRAALDRHDAPPLLRVVGCEGSGTRELAGALLGAGLPRPQVVDIDDHAPGRPEPEALPVPDTEVLCLCAAPCGHEVAWIHRARRHPLLVVATRTERRDDPRPPWADDLLRVSPSSPDDAGTARLVTAVSQHLSGLPLLRATRLRAELEAVAARPTATEAVGSVLGAADEDDG